MNREYTKQEEAGKNCSSNLILFHVFNINREYTKQKEKTEKIHSSSLILYQVFNMKATLGG